MTPPDEIVCETAAAFHAKLRTHHGIALYGNPVNPGDSVTLGGITVVYRPPAPKPVPTFSDGLNAAREMCVAVMASASDGAMKARDYGQDRRAWEEHGRFDGANEVNNRLRECLGLPLDAPPPLRDEGREAFEKWAEGRVLPPDGWWTASMAFLAGRASVKP